MANIKWINIDDKSPIVNEIIIYNGNLCGREGRNMGNSFVQMSNGEIDQFDEWVPKNKGFVTMKVTHVDGITKIEAKGEVNGDLFTCEYKYKGMTYGATIPLSSFK